MEMYMKISKLYSLIGVFLLGIFLSLGAYATDMGKVINLAGKQRMLTQKMSKEALLVAKGIDAKGNTENLKKTAALFDKTLKGLIGGDADLGLDKTEDKGIVEQLNKVVSLWTPFNENIQKIVSGKVDKDALKAIAEQNVPLLKAMNAAVQMYAKASGSSLDKGVATTINLAGKQRMLTQKMTKELLLVANGIDVDASKKALAETVSLFEKTLTGLVKGDSNLGIPATTDKSILAQLDKIKGLWDGYKPVLDKVDVSDDGLKSAASKNLPLLKEMNAAVKMYEKAAKK
jgi:nitrate/nitrite-specific signal transduction histidine kinase